MQCYVASRKKNKHFISTNLHASQQDGTTFISTHLLYNTPRILLALSAVKTYSLSKRYVIFIPEAGRLLLPVRVFTTVRALSIYNGPCIQHFPNQQTIIVTLVCTFLIRNFLIICLYILYKHYWQHSKCNFPRLPECRYYIMHLGGVI